ncbi:MAG: putative integral rane protein, partial [Frankiales bacterium]|nr:putative integral rane protein [Frankiales bacterium]
RGSARAHGAHSSGLDRLIELHAVQSAADAAVAIALAGTLFFNVPVNEARGKVALYLLMTLAPFAVVAPFVGPLLDRFRSGRRYAIAATCLARGFCVWVMAGALDGEGLALYPAAFAVLVLGKGYGVARSAAVPRLLPRSLGLVRANARVTLAGTIAAVLFGPVALGLAHFIGSDWLLRVTAVLYVVAMVLALRLPAAVDSPLDSNPQVEVGPHGTQLLLPAAPPPQSSNQWWRMGRPLSLPSSIVAALRAQAALRALAGFLTLYVAFLIRNGNLGGLSQTTALALLVVSAVAGGVAGTWAGDRIPSRSPHQLLAGLVAATALACGAAAVFFSPASAMAMAALAGFSQALGKLALDAVIQRDTVDDGRASAFARTETLLQLAWVVGGALGLAPIVGTWGFGLAAVVLAAGLVVSIKAGLRWLPGRHADDPPQLPELQR